MTEVFIFEVEDIDADAWTAEVAVAAQTRHEAYKRLRDAGTSGTVAWPLMDGWSPRLNLGEWQRQQRLCRGGKLETVTASFTIRLTSSAS